MKKIFDNFNHLGKAPKDSEPDYQYPLASQGRITAGDFEFKQGGFFLVAGILIMIVFSWKLLDLQVTQGAKHLYLAEGNRIRLQRILAPRGIIYDRKDKPLVHNVLRYDLEIIPALLPQEEAKRSQYFDKIQTVTGLDMEKYKRTINKDGLYSIDPLVLQEDLTQQQSLAWQIEFEEMEGVKINLNPLRRYESDYGLSHIMGYIGKISKEELKDDKSYNITDWIGKTGLEQFYEKQLQGKEGQRQIEVDAQGRLQRLIAEIAPQQGQNLKLHLDFNLQKRAYEALKNKLEELDKDRAVAMAVNPRTGGVLALVSLPDYNNNLFVRSGSRNEKINLFSDKSHPLINRVISGVYPTGSTIKPLVASLALQDKVVSENYKVDTPAEIKIGEWSFPDWKNHGLTDIRRAIAESNNIFFYALGGGWDKIKGLGIDRLEKGLREFNLGSLTRIDLPGEKKGLVPGRAWKKEVKSERWYLGDTYHLSIGQGDIGVTPVQLLMAISSIANGGTLYMPRLADIGKSRILKKDFIGEHNLQVVRDGMKMAVEVGSARGLQGVKDKAGNPVSLAAKTGTAQTGKKDAPHAWFVCFAPVENPEIAIVVLVEEGGQGHEAALPVAKEMLEEWFARRP